MFARAASKEGAKLADGERAQRERVWASLTRRDVRAASAMADPLSGPSESEES